METTSVDGLDDVGEDEKEGDVQEGTVQGEAKRQILLIKRKGNLVSQNL